MEVGKMIFLSKWVIYRFHVNLPGCTPIVLSALNKNPVQVAATKLHCHQLFWISHLNSEVGVNLSHFKD